MSEVFIGRACRRRPRRRSSARSRSKLPVGAVAAGLAHMATLSRRVEPERQLSTVRAPAFAALAEQQGRLRAIAHTKAANARATRRRLASRDCCLPQRRRS